MGEEDGPREEDDERPYVEHLGQVDGGDVVVLVAQDDAAVPDHKGREAEKETDVWPQVEKEARDDGECGLSYGDACDGEV